MVVKTLGREPEETERFAAKAHHLRDVNIRVGQIRAAFDPTLAALPNIGVLIVLAVGVSRVLNGSTDPGDVVTVAYLLTIVSFPIRSIGWLLGEFPRSVVGYRRVRSVLNATGEMRFGEAQAPETDGGVALGVDNVTYRYVDDQRLLENLTFHVEPDRTVALVGATASGKSTLTTLLTRLVDPQDGRITVDGVDLRDLARGELAELLSIVPQTAFLFDDTVRGNITLGADVSDAEVWEALRAAQGDGFVAALPDGPGHPPGRARHVPVRWPEAADLPRAGAGPPAAVAHPRRCDLGGRPGGRGPDPRGAPGDADRLHTRGGGLPQGDDRARRRGALSP